MKFAANVLILSILCFATGCFAIGAQAAQKNQCALNSEIKGEDSIPWPWGNEIQMPWESLEGTWQVINDDCDSYFSFENSGKNLTPSQRLIRVVQYHSGQCQKVSWGYGFDSQRILRASMTDGRSSFNLTVRAFDARAGGVSQLFQQKISLKPIMVLTLFSKKGWKFRKSFEIQKISSKSKPACL